MDKRLLRQRLLAWFADNQRALPWRATRHPYAIWVSEVMLQQTQVTTVIPFFLRFIKRFPAIRDLAQASEHEVLQYWEGLGYYRRARHLHQAAQLLVTQHDGEFPDNYSKVLALPGLGRYTAGAILSQAFEQRLPIVDANVARILCRLLAWTEPLEAKVTQTWLWDTATALLPNNHVGDFNQALMELGQTVCTVGEPSCLLCPLLQQCQGRAQGLQATLPLRQARKQVTQTRERAIVLTKGNKVLLCQRPPDASRWANMWEFPTAPLDATPVLQGVDDQSQLLTGYQTDQATSAGSITYGITRYQVTLHIVKAICLAGRQHRQHYQKLIWIKPSELKDYPLSVPQRRVAVLL